MLDNKVILVTRPPSLAQPLITLLKQYQANVVAQPMIAINPVADHRQHVILSQLRQLHAEKPAAIVVTSPSAARLLFDLIDQDNIAKIHLQAQWWFAVGHATAQVLYNRNIKTVCIAKHSTSQSLIPTIKQFFGDKIKNIRILLPHSDLADLRWAKELENDGAQVTSCVLYHVSRIVPPASAKLPDPLHWITLTSPSTAASFFQAYDLPDSTKIACIGTTTAHAISTMVQSPTKVVIAAHHNIQSMIDTMVHHEAVNKTS